jgi:hypothetical protein
VDLVHLAVCPWIEHEALQRFLSGFGSVRVLNGQLCSAPVIHTEIATGKLQVRVPFPEEQARELVKKINEATRR